eukprot:403341138
MTDNKLTSTASDTQKYKYQQSDDLFDEEDLSPKHYPGQLIVNEQLKNQLLKSTPKNKKNSQSGSDGKKIQQNQYEQSNSKGHQAKLQILPNYSLIREVKPILSQNEEIIGQQQDTSDTIENSEIGQHLQNQQQQQSFNLHLDLKSYSPTKHSLDEQNFDLFIQSLTKIVEGSLTQDGSVRRSSLKIQLNPFDNDQIPEMTPDEIMKLNNASSSSDDNNGDDSYFEGDSNNWDNSGNSKQEQNRSIRADERKNYISKTGLKTSRKSRFQQHLDGGALLQTPNNSPLKRKRSYSQEKLIGLFYHFGQDNQQNSSSKVNDSSSVNGNFSIRVEEVKQNSGFEDDNSSIQNQFDNLKVKRQSITTLSNQSRKKLIVSKDNIKFSSNKKDLKVKSISGRIIDEQEQIDKSIQLNQSTESIENNKLQQDGFDICLNQREFNLNSRMMPQIIEPTNELVNGKDSEQNLQNTNGKKSPEIQKIKVLNFSQLNQNENSRNPNPRNTINLTVNTLQNQSQQTTLLGVKRHYLPLTPRSATHKSELQVPKIVKANIQREDILDLSHNQNNGQVIDQSQFQSQNNANNEQLNQKQSRSMQRNFNYQQQILNQFDKIESSHNQLNLPTSNKTHDLQHENSERSLSNGGSASKRSIPRDLLLDAKPNVKYDNQSKKLQIIEKMRALSVQKQHEKELKQRKDQLQNEEFKIRRVKKHESLQIENRNNQTLIKNRSHQILSTNSSHDILNEFRSRECVNHDHRLLALKTKLQQFSSRDNSHSRQICRADVTRNEFQSLEESLRYDRSRLEADQMIETLLAPTSTIKYQKRLSANSQDGSGSSNSNYSGREHTKNTIHRRKAKKVRGYSFPKNIQQINKLQEDGKITEQ